MAVLFPGVLRPWPQKYLRKFYDEKRWTNFYHILDPVSGYVRDPRYFVAYGEGEQPDRLVPQTYHSPKLWTLPGVAHVSYWRTPLISEYIITQTHPGMPDADQITLDSCPRNWFSLFIRHLVMLGSLLVALVLAAAPIVIGALALGWLVEHVFIR
jgi:hypothetical protein